jgi:pSer/pThr/pTyr-binding forkhead associated (FHA) protein
MAPTDDDEAGTPRPVEPPDHTSTLNLGPLAGETDPDMRTDEHPAEAVETLAPGTALLVVQRGPNAGSRYLLDADVTSVGRHPDAAIFLDDVTVSRRHAEFRREGAGFRVVDVGSLNGTYVNRHRIDDVVLANSDEVQVGKYRLLYLSGVPADTQ